MGFGKSKKSPTPKEPTPQVVVQPGSGSGVVDTSTVAAQQRTEAVPEQQTLLAPNQQDDELLKKGVG